MKVKLRYNKKGKKAYLMLDSFEGYYIDDNGKKKQKRYRENIGLWVYLKPKGPVDRMHNKKMKALADEIVSNRNAEYIQNKWGLTNHEKRDMIFLDYFESYILNKNSSINDLQIFDIVKNHLVKYAGRSTRCMDVDYKFCKNFAQYLMGVKKQTGKALSSSTMDSYFKKFQLVLKEMVKEKILPENPAKDVKSILPKVKHKERIYLTDDELEMLIATDLPQTNLRKFYLLSCFTGLRHSDCKNLKWKNIETVPGGWNEKGTAVLPAKHYVNTIMQKTKEPIKIPLSSDALKVMGDRQGDDDYVITGLKYSGRANQIIETWGYKAGLKKTLTPHTARHTFAVRYLYQTGDIFSLMKMMGHTDISTTQVYLHIVEKLRDENMMKLKKLMPDE